MIHSNDKLSFVWVILSNALPPIGFILYFKHRHQYPKKASTALINGLVGIPIGVIGGYILQNYIF